MEEKINWQQTVFSDGSPCFVSKSEPQLNDKVSIRIRLIHNDEIQQVKLRILKDGEAVYLSMHLLKNKEGIFDYYEAEVEMSQLRLQYLFLLISDNQIYYYNQQGLSILSPDREHDFVLLANYKQPQWVKGSTFYQIFPERFCNGNPSISVKDGEYQLNGYKSMAVQDWNSPAAPYEKSHCVDFYGGDLYGIIQKIPYLKQLGVTALYINPIFLSPSVHKYDCVDYLQVDPHFGGNEALALLSKELHRNGMHLILDISINHTSTEYRWFNKDGDYFDKSEGGYNNPDSLQRQYYYFNDDNTYQCWHGVSTMPKLNYTSELLKDELYRKENSVLKTWLKEPYCIDGWRFDVADVMANFGVQQLSKEVWPQIRENIRQANPQSYILAEHWDDCTDYLQGDCWDATMNYYGFGRIIRQFYGLPDPYVEFNFKTNKAENKLSAEAFRLRAESFLSRLPYTLQQMQYNLFDSHDTGRFSSYKGVNENMLIGAVVASFMMPGVPSVYYGDEASIKGDPGTFEGARYPMPWDSSFEESRIFKIHQKLCFMRKEHQAFAQGSFKFLYSKDGVIALTRFDEQEAYLAIISNNDHPITIELDTTITGFDFAQSIRKTTDELGNCLIANVNNNNLCLTIESYGTYVVSNKAVVQK